MNQPDEGNTGSSSILAAVQRGAIAEAVELLLGVAMGENEWEREPAFEAARRIPDAAPLLPPLLDGLRAAEDAERRNAARSVLAVLAGADAADPGPVIAELAQVATADADADARILATHALGESRNSAALQPLTQAIRDPDPNVAAAAADGLGTLAGARAIEALAAVAAGAEDPWVRVAAVVALGRTGDRRALAPLERAIADPVVAETAVTALKEIGDPAALPLLEPLLESKGYLSELAVEAAFDLLAAHPGSTPGPALRNVLDTRVPELRDRLDQHGDESAAILLGLAGTEEAAHALVQALSGAHAAAAAAGFRSVPPELAERVLLDRLDRLDPDHLIWAITALPSLSSAESVERVIPNLGAADPHVQVLAAELLGRSPESLVAQPLIRALRRAELRYGAARALGMLGSARCLPLAHLLNDADVRVRRAAADGLSRCEATDVRDRIIEALRSESDAPTCAALLQALGMAGGDEAVAVLEAYADDPKPEMRFAAVRALGHARSPAALPRLIRSLGDPAGEIRGAALQALGELGDVQAAAAVAGLLDASDPDLRFAAATTLREIPSRVVEDRLVAALEDDSWAVRHAAVRALHQVGDPESAPALQTLATHDADPLVRSAAREALDSLASSPSAGDAAP